MVQGRTGQYRVNVPAEICTCMWKSTHPGRQHPWCWHLRVAEEYWRRRDMEPHWTLLARLVRDTLGRAAQVRLEGKDYLLVDGLDAIRINELLNRCEKDLRHKERTSP